MKRIILILIGLLITTNVYAVDITVTITQDQFDAMSVMTVTPQQWVQEAIDNKSNSMVDRLVEKHSDKQPSKLSEAQKNVILNSIDLNKERAERRGN